MIEENDRKDPDEEEIDKLKKKKKKIFEELEVDNSDIPVHEEYVKEENIKK